MVLSGPVRFMGYGDLWGLELTVLIFHSPRSSGLAAGGLKALCVGALKETNK